MAQEESMYTRCSLILASCSRNNHALAVRDCFLNRALQAVHSHFYNWALFLLVKLLVLERPAKNLYEFVNPTGFLFPRRGFHWFFQISSRELRREVQSQSCHNDSEESSRVLKITPFTLQTTSLSRLRTASVLDNAAGVPA